MRPEVEFQELWEVLEAVADFRIMGMFHLRRWELNRRPDPYLLTPNYLSSLAHEMLQRKRDNQTWVDLRAVKINIVRTNFAGRFQLL